MIGEPGNDDGQIARAVIDMLDVDGEFPENARIRVLGVLEGDDQLAAALTASHATPSGPADDRTT